MRNVLTRIQRFSVRFFVVQILAAFMRGNYIDKKILHGRLDSEKHKLAKKYLYKTYGDLIKTYEAIQDYSPINIDENLPIWIFWYQGLENMPDIIHVCVESIRKQNPNRKVIFLDKDNYCDYISLPNHILLKFKTGGIGLAHFSDCIRMSLLSERGGIWMDATILQTSPLYDEITLYPFFSLKGAYKDNPLWTSFFVASNKGDIVTSFIRDFLFEYWKKEDVAIEYLFMDDILQLGYENVPIIRKEIEMLPDIVENEVVFRLFYVYFNKDYNVDIFNTLCNESPVHKLSYRYEAGNKESFCNYFLNLYKKS